MILEKVELGSPFGYKFSYDRLGRLTDAEYGEGPSLL